MARQDDKPGDDARGIGRLKTEGDLERFVMQLLKKPGQIGTHHIAGMDGVLKGRMRMGRVDITGTGAVSASETVTHGMTDTHGEPLAPERIFVTTDDGSINAAFTSVSDTTFDVINRHVDNVGYATETRNDWLALA